MRKSKMKAPVAEQLPHKNKVHNETLVDDYHWLRDDNWPNVKDKKVLNYLEQENSYVEAVMKPHKKLQDDLYKELKGRIKEDDDTVPVKKDDYYYYGFIKKGQDYWVRARKHKSLDAKEEILIDENKLAKGKDYLKVGRTSVSPDHRLYAYSTDFKGDERFTIYVKDLETGKLLKDEINNTFGDPVWHENGEGFFYTPADENWRALQVFYHKLGTEKSDDKLIYEEKDNTFRVSPSKSSSRKYIFITAASNTETEVHYIDCQDPGIELRIIERRKKDHLYSVGHHGDEFYITTNDESKNFRVVKAPVKNPQKENWKEVIAHSKDTYIEGISLYENHMVVSKKEAGLEKIEVVSLESEESYNIEFPDAAYSASVAYTTYDAKKLRFAYNSLNTPYSVKEIGFDGRAEKTLKVQEIPSGFDSGEYQVERLWAKARDGEKVPISLIYRKDKFKKDGSNPLYLYGYGSYGISIEPGFHRNAVSLIDRGFVYAIAHIRGGDDLGYEWYETAKFLGKKKTFYDFIDVADHLVKAGYGSEGNIAIAGGSAGGMLMGVCINERPELYRAVIAHVPFVDVLNTMLDEDLPLTPGEFKEWGNPKNKEFYDYIKSYSPYDNVKAQDYPNMLVTAGLTDPRVTYWEPAKWVAKLRDIKTDDNLLLFKTNMEAGHGGKSGRFEYLKEVALEYAFVLKSFGVI